ncbi:hypothetical protein MTO96_042411 [Rhipicephalus appendiculatus]
MGHWQWEKQCIKATGDLGTQALSGLLNAHQKFVTFELWAFIISCTTEATLRWSFMEAWQVPFVNWQ